MPVQPTTYGLLDKAIAIAIVLFILSMISERFITWFKLYFFKKGNTLLGLFNWDKDYSVKTDDPVFEKERERRILLLNIVLSIMIALLAHADLFKILQNPSSPYDALGWHYDSWSGGGKETDSKYLFLIILKSILGCILGGLFISLGSKFWHDLLDTLFAVKNLKEKLGQKATYEVNSTDELDTWLKLTTGDIVKKVFEDNKELIRNLKNVVSIGIGHDADNKKCIEVHISDTDTHLIPKTLPYTLASGQVVPVTVNVVCGDKITTQAKPTSEITNGTRTSDFGSFGLAVCFKKDPDEKPMLLSCYHVLKGKDHDYSYFEIINEEDIVSPHNTNQLIGRLKLGIRTKEIDAAIMTPLNNTVLENKLPDNKRILGTRKIDYEENYSDISVKLYGAVSRSSGKISSLSNYASIEYILPGGQTENWGLYNLIAIVGDSGNPFSQGGDSGSAVLDSNNNVVGLIVAGNKKISYAMPIQTVLDNLNLKLKL